MAATREDKPAVLFLCVHNAGRSQMTMGFFRYYAGDAAVAWSGGSEPAERVNPAAVEAMKEPGIDISREYPKPWTDDVVRATDVVITMGCGDACPSSLASATRSGLSTTRPAVTSLWCALSATRSSAASYTCSPNSACLPAARHRDGATR